VCVVLRLIKRWLEKCRDSAGEGPRGLGWRF
jgi:hypothetical protein